MSIHFDILYIGNDEKIWNFLEQLSEEYDLKILKSTNVSGLNFIKDDFSFTTVLTELHLDYNYEGFTVDKIGLKNTFLGILNNEINENEILVSEYLFANQEKFLLLKKEEIIYYFLVSRPKLNNFNKIALEA